MYNWVFAVQQKLAQHCKSTILKKKKKERKRGVNDGYKNTSENRYPLHHFYPLSYMDFTILSFHPPECSAQWELKIACWMYKTCSEKKASFLQKKEIAPAGGKLLNKYLLILTLCPGTALDEQAKQTELLPSRTLPSSGGWDGRQ